MEGIGVVCFSMVEHGIQMEEERREEKRERWRRIRFIHYIHKLYTGYSGFAYMMHYDGMEERLG